MKIVFLLAFISAFFTLQLVHATPASESLFNKYKTAGASNFDSTHGKALWHQEVKNNNGEILSCGTCHGNDLNQSGKHRTTNKMIDPMTTHANPARFTDERKMEKWFKRNCNDTWARECTPQEKGDILMYLLNL